MKNLIGLALLIVWTFSIGCEGGRQQVPSVAPTEAVPIEQQLFTLATVKGAFEAKNIPMINITVYDEKTDPNSLLGRPNQYVEKMNFDDARIEKSKRQQECTIEIFTTEDDALRRKEYLETIGKAASIFGSYIYHKRNIVARVSFKLPPSEANQYEEAIAGLE